MEPISSKSPLLWLGLAVGAYFLLRPSSQASAVAPATGPTSPNYVPPQQPIVTPALPISVEPGQSTSSTSSSARPGYPMEGETDIVFASAANRAAADSAGAPFDRQYGEGSRNVRVNTFRAVGAACHIFVEDIARLEGFLFDQGGRSWDEVHYYFLEDPTRAATIMQSYTQRNPATPITRRW